jgi:exopolysaccharide biosynthesis polyprenyl glycosylphosphotransferase
MIKRKYRIAYFIFSLVESLITAISYGLAYLIRKELPAPLFGPLFPFSDYLVLLVVIIGLWNLLFALLRAQRTGPAEDPFDIIKEVGFTVILGSVLISASIFFFKLEFISRPLIAIFALVNFLLLCGFRIFAKAELSQFQSVLDGERNVVIVGTDEKAADLVPVLEDARKWGYRIVGVVRESEESPVDPRLRSYPLLELGRMGDVLRNHVVDEAIFAVSKETLAKLEEVFLMCEEEGVKTRVMLNFFPHVTSKVYLEALQDVPLLTFTTTPQNEYLLFIKNLLDASIAALAIVLLSPVLLLVALLVKLTSKGPVIFRQTRCGLGGRKFTLYKFRSMIEDAEESRQQLEHLNLMSGPVFKARDDPRVIPIGRFLRKFSIDELPQLYNILRGDMSFVGPRPPIPQEVNNYERWQRRRLRMKPGLTCLWQVSGRNQIDFDEWMRMDLLYIDNWSLLLDLKIFLKTIPIVLLGKEGV